MNMMGDRGLVLGGSMAGLMTAAVLADSYRHVTVVERDTLTGSGQARKGVPQSRHAHALLAGGARALETLFPGLLDELVETGAPKLDNYADFYFSPGGHLFLQGDQPASVTLYQPSRPHLERVVRDRVRALPNVEIVDGCETVGLATSIGKQTVVGARVCRVGDQGTEDVMHADLVVDTTGRSGRTASWLPAIGYQPPPKEELTVGVGYATQHFRIAPGAAPRERLVVIGAVPGRPTTLALLAQEDDLWTLTLGGYGAHQPPTGPRKRLDLVRSLVPPHIFDAVRDAEPVSEIYTHRFPANRRYHYERLQRFPAGLLVLGDSMCSFNPLYGQGMSVAAAQALALRDTLASGGRDLSRRFFRAASKPIDVAWQFAVGGDLALPEVNGPRPLSVRIANAYVGRVLAAAEHDLEVAEQFSRVNHLLDPPSKLFAPHLLWRFLAGSGRRRRVSVLDQVPAAP